MADVHVVEVGAARTHDLRRRVLREGRADAEVTFPEDATDGGFHLAVVADDGEVVAVGSFFPSPTPYRPGRRAFQLRGMAVEPVWQGRGAGRLLLDEARARLRGAGVEVLWANGRDTALGFYRRMGLQVVGEGFLSGPSPGIPHHVVIEDL